jgi:ribosomal protein L22
MVDIIAVQIENDKYNIVIDAFMLKELEYAINHLNAKRKTMTKIYDKSLKEKNGDDFVKRNKKKKDIINLLINKLDNNSVSNKLIVENLVVNNLIVNNLVVNNL